MKGKHPPEDIYKIGAVEELVQTLQMAEHGGSHRKKERHIYSWMERGSKKGKQKHLKEKKENITTDVYILGQCNQVENKKKKKQSDNRITKM